MTDRACIIQNIFYNLITTYLHQIICIKDICWSWPSPGLSLVDSSQKFALIDLYCFQGNKIIVLDVKPLCFYFHNVIILSNLSSGYTLHKETRKIRGTPFVLRFMIVRIRSCLKSPLMNVSFFLPWCNDMKWHVRVSEGGGVEQLVVIGINCWLCRMGMGDMFQTAGKFYHILLSIKYTHVFKIRYIFLIALNFKLFWI